MNFLKSKKSLSILIAIVLLFITGALFLNFYSRAENPVKRNSCITRVNTQYPPYKEDPNLKVSVIVPTYNTNAEYLDQCIKSLIDQTLFQRGEMEFIIVNDGSTNLESLKVLKKFEKDKTNKGKFVNFNKNLGVSVARNEGLKRARGKYVAFLDSDDFVDKDCYEKAFSFAENVKKRTNGKECDILEFGACCTKNNAIWEWWVVPDDALYTGDLSCNFFNRQVWPYCWNHLYRRELIYKNNIKFDEEINFGEDLIFYINAMKMANVLKTTNVPLMVHRMGNTGGLSSAKLIRGTDVEGTNIEKYIKYLPKLLEAWDNPSDNFSQKFVKKKAAYELASWVLGHYEMQTLGEEKQKAFSDLITNEINKTSFGKLKVKPEFYTLQKTGFGRRDSEFKYYNKRITDRLRTKSGVFLKERENESDIKKTREEEPEVVAAISSGVIRLEDLTEEDLNNCVKGTYDNVDFKD